MPPQHTNLYDWLTLCYWFNYKVSTNQKGLMKSIQSENCIAFIQNRKIGLGLPSIYISTSNTQLYVCILYTLEN